MSPEDAAIRLVRVEERVQDHADRLKFLQPLPAQYAVSEEKVATLRNDLNKAIDSIRKEIAEIKTEQAERNKERRTMLLALFIAGIGLLGTFLATLVPLLSS